MPTTTACQRRAAATCQVSDAGKELILAAARDKGKKISVVLKLLNGETADKD